MPPVPDYAFRIVLYIVDKTTDGFHVAIRNVFVPDNDLWETFSPTQLRLCMSRSGTSATLLFKDCSSSERFSIALGIHNDKPWCDIVLNLPDNADLSIINNSYYKSRVKPLEANSTRARRVSSRGTTVLLEISEMEWDGGYTAKVTISST
ncbi:Cytolysin/lectin [Russula earlei]|uniref:Cytolysin/lectin n=1 Tax=Russula earlei TaxID=71964 RepID=A0ACC0TWQ2_9AGAM|nr:Cytolysin/lectin [Russula earlei]